MSKRAITFQKTYRLTQGEKRASFVFVTENHNDAVNPDARSRRRSVNELGGLGTQFWGRPRRATNSPIAQLLSLYAWGHCLVGEYTQVVDGCERAGIRPQLGVGVRQHGNCRKHITPQTVSRVATSLLFTITSMPGMGEARSGEPTINST